jgi:hypothetical protein
MKNHNPSFPWAACLVGAFVLASPSWAAPEHNCDFDADCGPSQTCNVPNDGPDGGMRPLIDGGFRGWCVEMPHGADAGTEPLADSGAEVESDGGQGELPDAGAALDAGSAVNSDSGQMVDAGPGNENGGNGGNGSGDGNGGGPEIGEDDEKVAEAEGCTSLGKTGKSFSWLASGLGLVFLALRRRRT